MGQESKQLFVGTQPNVAQALYQCVAETAVTTMMAEFSLECNRNGVWAITCTFSGNL